MTTIELRDTLNNEFNLDKWPETYYVDAETYGNVCQDLFDYLILVESTSNYIKLFLGKHNGIMFKNTELILRRDE